MTTATRKVIRKKVMAPPPTTKSFPTAYMGLAMIILTNYQAEVKQALALFLKTLT
jgi:hypothetical protein